jgi:hypothetical protein
VNLHAREENYDGKWLEFYPIYVCAFVRVEILNKGISDRYLLQLASQMVACYLQSKSPSFNAMYNCVGIRQSFIVEVEVVAETNGVVRLVTRFPDKQLWVQVL